jgi:hypothetical protein
MTTLSKTFIAAASFVVIATAAFSKGPMEFKSGMAYVYAEPGKMSAMAMVPGERNQEDMMKRATKVPNHTVIFMDNGQAGRPGPENNTKTRSRT